MLKWISLRNISGMGACIGSVDVELAFLTLKKGSEAAIANVGREQNLLSFGHCKRGASRRGG